MRRVATILTLVFTFVVLSSSAHAALTVLGRDDGGATYIYGTDTTPQTLPGTRQLILDDTPNPDVIWYDRTIGANTQEIHRKYAETLEVTFSGDVFSDWRLPTVAEFESIYSYGKIYAQGIFENLLDKTWLTDEGLIFNMRTGLSTTPGIYDYSALPVHTVPIPSAVILLGFGLVSLGVIRRKKT